MKKYLLLILLVFQLCFLIPVQDTCAKPLNASVSKNETIGEIVVFNTKSKKYHKADCTWAKKCTVNCVYITKNEAIEKGGLPCKICGGE